MAEVLGVVAGGMGIGSLANQIVGSVQQILDLWSSIKDAPENVQSLLEELNLLGNLLSKMSGDGDEAEEQSLSLRQATTEVTRYCQLAPDSIDGVLKHLASEMTSNKRRIRQWAAVKVTVKGKRLEKSLARLERAKSLLTLAYQCYTQYVKIPKGDRDSCTQGQGE